MPTPKHYGQLRRLPLNHYKMVRRLPWLGVSRAHDIKLCSHHSRGFARAGEASITQH